MTDWITLLLAIGVVLRVTRLVATDTITAGLRDRTTGWLHTLLTCGWCVSMWIAFPVAASWWAWSHCSWWVIASLALTASWAAGAFHFAGQPTRHEVMPVGPLTVHTRHTRDEPEPGQGGED